MYSLSILDLKKIYYMESFVMCSIRLYLNKKYTDLQYSKWPNSFLLCFVKSPNFSNKYFCYLSFYKYLLLNNTEVVSRQYLFNLDNLFLLMIYAAEALYGNHKFIINLMLNKSECTANICTMNYNNKIYKHECNYE